jgi:AcrR family transcriptional regulator
MVTKRAEQGRATRDHLVEVASRLFAERGYEDTSIEDVLTAAQVSRGALYHHFAGKDALFVAVMELVEGRIAASLRAAIAQAPDPVAALHAAALGWISLAGDPAISRIVLIDGPAVIGLERWREGGQQAVAEMRVILQAISDQGRLASGLVGSFAHILVGALDEIALVVAQADDPAAVLGEGRTAVTELLDRLIDPAPAP